ncbi:hypothetical protein [Parvularcula oceani]|uniref:hypothetical protein n=1 Tax=Parvularcula oceani TaxID=1247963 RepID=UPI0012DCE93C|nr:hypothetical protein [Parvularcula oceani]
MKSLLADSLVPLIAVAVAALGGAFFVFGEYDDSPGAMLIGCLAVLGAAVTVVVTGRRRA